MTEATERGELRELLFGGVVPPADTEAMFERTFSASGDDGAHLLPPDDLFDGTADLPPDDLTLDDGTLLGDGSEPDLGDDDTVVGDLADPTGDWSDPADVTRDADPAAPDVPFDHPTSGW